MWNGEAVVVLHLHNILIAFPPQLVSKGTMNLLLSLCACYFPSECIESELLSDNHEHGLVVDLTRFLKHDN